jgi:hypothetical protein
MKVATKNMNVLKVSKLSLLTQMLVANPIGWHDVLIDMLILKLVTD